MLKKFKTFKLYFNTIKYLKLIQIFYRIKYKLIKNKSSEQLKLSAGIKQGANDFLIKNNSKFKPPNIFDFLNKTEEINNNWNKKSLTKLWLYNLHYFDYLNSNCDIKPQKAIILKWIENNPIGSGNGWEPYPISLRVVNWAKWLLKSQINNQNILNSMANQANYLEKNIEYHLLGNHLLANTKAFIFAGCLFINEDKGRRWLNLGLKILSGEIKAQVLHDGGHFELSPMYHSIILEDILDIINILNLYSENIFQATSNLTKKEIKKLPEFSNLNNIFSELKSKSSKMLTWLQAISHPDKKIAFFNDSSFNIAPENSSIINYAKKLGIESNFLTNKNYYLENSGYIRFQNESSTLIADVANIGPDYIPGHAHADNLSFEFSIYNQRVFINLGTSTYENNDLRALQRSTKSHNTVEIDDINSSEVWSAFRVGKRAKIINKHIDLDNNFAQATHNGYIKQLQFPVIHSRSWQLFDNKLEIIDKLATNTTHNANIYFHLHPNIKIIDLKENILNLCITEINKNINLIFDNKLHIKIIDNYYYPEFNKSIKTKTIILSNKFNESTIFKHTITWNN